MISIQFKRCILWLKMIRLDPNCPDPIRPELIRSNLTWPDLTLPHLVLPWEQERIHWAPILSWFIYKDCKIVNESGQNRSSNLVFLLYFLSNSCFTLKQNRGTWLKVKKFELVEPILFVQCLQFRFMNNVDNDDFPLQNLTKRCKDN